MSLGRAVWQRQAPSRPDRRRSARRQRDPGVELREKDIGQRRYAAADVRLITAICNPRREDGRSMSRSGKALLMLMVLCAGSALRAAEQPPVVQDSAGINGIAQPFFK